MNLLFDRLRYEAERQVDRMLRPQVPDTRSEVRVATASREARDVAMPTEASSEAAWDGAGETRDLAPDLGYPIGSLDALGNSDVRALRDILLAGPPKLRLLVGHSKGNLLINFVLNHMKTELEDMADELRNEHHPLFNHLSVVTLGAVVGIPTDTFGLNIYQFLGQFDALGQINSDRDPPIIGKIAIAHEVIPDAGHHLNPRIPLYLPVEEALRRVKLPLAEDVSPREVGGNGRTAAPSWGHWSSIIARRRVAGPRTHIS